MAQVREVRLDWREATGPCKARSLAQALWEGEPYVLQIDSHMRFSVGWDQLLIAWLHRAERASSIGRAVLSTYPPAYQASLQPEPDFGCSYLQYAHLERPRQSFAPSPALACCHQGHGDSCSASCPWIIAVASRSWTRMSA